MRHTGTLVNKNIMKAFLLSLNNKANIANQWDFAMVSDMLDELEIEKIQVTELNVEDTAIVIIPARHHVGREKKINIELNKIKKVIFFCMGDEEGLFDLTKILHDDIEIWVQNPHLDKHDIYHKIGTGYSPHVKKYLKKIDDPLLKNIDIFFSGQVTHQRREELVEVLNGIDDDDFNIVVNETEGFTQGFDKKTYTTMMASCKIAPAPSGAVVPDSFRLFEALEAMSIPIADEKTSNGDIVRYWDWLFGETTPFPKITNWDTIISLRNELAGDYKSIIHNQTSWYMLYKRKLKNKLKVQLYG